MHQCGNCLSIIDGPRLQRGQLGCGFWHRGLRLNFTVESMRSPEDSSTSHDASPVVPYRYFDFSESSSSLATATTQMSESTSLYTVTSSGTVPGIGALSGRGIRAVGKLQLRGMEWIVLQAKFANFRRLFPHKDETTAVGLEEAYDDILELTRFVLYLFFGNQIRISGWAYQTKPLL